MRELRFKIAWWLEGLPWRKTWTPGKPIPWYYRLGMRIMPKI